LRDIGGFVFDLYRFGQRRDALVRDKLEDMLATDREFREIERLLDAQRAIHEVRQPGVAACPECETLYTTDSRFCSHCGHPLGGGRRRGGAREPEPPPVEAGAPAVRPISRAQPDSTDQPSAPEPEAESETQPTKPAAEPEAEAPAPPPSAATPPPAEPEPPPTAAPPPAEPEPPAAAAPPEPARADVESAPSTPAETAGDDQDEDAGRHASAWLPPDQQPGPPAETDPDSAEQEAVPWEPQAPADDTGSAESAGEAGDGTTTSGEPAPTGPDEPSSR
jgi:hypothetical protein